MAASSHPCAQCNRLVYCNEWRLFDGKFYHRVIMAMRRFVLWSSRTPRTSFNAPHRNDTCARQRLYPLIMFRYHLGITTYVCMWSIISLSLSLSLGVATRLKSSFVMFSTPIRTRTSLVIENKSNRVSHTQL